MGIRIFNIDLDDVLSVVSAGTAILLVAIALMALWKFLGLFLSQVEHLF